MSENKSGQFTQADLDQAYEWDYVPDTEPGQAERDYDQREIATVRAEMEAEYEAEQRGEFDQRTEADAVAAHDAEYEERARERMAVAYDDPAATPQQQAEAVSDLIQARITTAGLDHVASRAEPEPEAE
jgi:hypothetical protein